MARTVPPRTDEQRKRALAKANATRSARAELKRRLAGDRRLIELRDLLADEPEEVLATMHVGELLLSAAAIGPTKAKAILARAQVSSSRTLAGLTDRARAALVTALDEEAERRLARRPRPETRHDRNR